MDRAEMNRREFLATGAAAALLATTPGLAAEGRPDVVIVRDKSRSVIKGFEVDAASDCQTPGGQGRDEPRRRGRRGEGVAQVR